MEGKIWNKDKWWEVNEYNKRLSEENKIRDKTEREEHRLDEDEKRMVAEVWK